MSRNLVNDTNELISISDRIYDLLTARSDDLDQILSLMEIREGLMNVMMPLLSGIDKEKFIELLGMFRDKEAVAILPYRAELERVEENIISVNKLGKYHGFGEGGTGA